MAISPNRYRNSFESLHSSAMNKSIIDIRRAIRKDFKRLDASNLEEIALFRPIETEKAYKARFQKTGIRWGNLVYNQLLEQKKFNPVFSEAWALFILRNSREFIGQQIKIISDTAKEEVKRVVKNNIERGGDAVVELRREIKNVVNSNSFYLWQAERIARTETTTAMNTASQVAADETDIIYQKQWLTALDGRERASHRALNGDKVSMGQKFDNGLLYPGDPTQNSVSASEIVNCRCTALNIPIQ